MTQSISDAALEILRKTNDGDDLSPQHLKLLEMAVSGVVNEVGEAAFYELLDNVRSGYNKPWFHNQKHLTIDHEGYVYWKGVEVEHYEIPWAYSEKAKSHAIELANHCQHLENIGETVNSTNAIWRWEQFAPKQKEASNG